MYELFANHREEMYDKLIRAEMNQRGEINMGSQKVTLKEIENLRHLLIQSAYDKGFTNVETIAVSQKLDVLLNKYTKLTCSKMK